jgi:ABC-type methionine transport system ATPase subunit
MIEVQVELFIPGELKDEPIIYNMIKEYDVFVKIVEASFSTESGWAFLSLKGEKKEMERLFKYLKDKGISVESRSE